MNPSHEEERRRKQLDALATLAAMPTDTPDGAHYVYKPNLSAAEWAVIGPYVRRVVQLSAPRTVYSEKELYPAASRLALFAWGTAGLPLEDDVVFDPGVINRYSQSELATRSRAGRSTIRARLRRMSEALLGDDARGRFHALGKAEASRPYEGPDLAAMRSWAAAQRHQERRTSAGALLALGLGAGLTGQEIIGARLDDVTFQPAGATIRVTTGNVRDVPVLREWGKPLRERLEHGDADGWVFRSGQRGGNVNLITDFVNRKPVPGVSIQARRMRATWLVTHLGRGTPLVPLMTAAGLKSAEAFDRFLPFVDNPGEPGSEAYLRGEWPPRSSIPQ